MALTQRLQIRQSQALVMTPQLMQAIKLLQLSNLDLVAYVEAELERNPLLDRSAEDGARRLREADAATAARQAADGRRDAGTPARAEASGNRDRGAARYPHGRRVSRPRRSQPVRAPPKDRRAIRNGPRSAPAAATTANTISKPSFPPRPRSPTGCASSSRSPSPIRAQRMIGQYLIDLVDEAGYLSGDLDCGCGKARHRRRTRSRPCSACCRASIRRESAHAIWPSA